MKRPDIYKEDPNNIKNYLGKIKAAFLAYMSNKFDEAIAQWPDYPQAHISKAEMSRKDLQEKGWPWFRDNVVEKAIAACPTSAAALIMATDFAMRSDSWTEAIKYCERSLVAKPENPVSLHQMTNIMREMALRAGDERERVHYFLQAREVARHLRNVSTQHFKEATDLIFLFNSKLAFKGEAAAAQKQGPKLAIAKPEGEKHGQPEASL
jgi:hypothetical protein